MQKRQTAGRRHLRQALLAELYRSVVVYSNGFRAVICKIQKKPKAVRHRNGRRRESGEN